MKTDAYEDVSKKEGNESEAEKPLKTQSNRAL